MFSMSVLNSTSFLKRLVTTFHLRGVCREQCKKINDYIAEDIAMIMKSHRSLAQRKLGDITLTKHFVTLRALLSMYIRQSKQIERCSGKPLHDFGHC